MNLLLQHGADVSLTTNAGDTALSIAVQRKQWIIARALVEHAGKVDYLQPRVAVRMLTLT